MMGDFLWVPVGTLFALGGVYLGWWLRERERRRRHKQWWGD